ncbi:hypothetical protein ONS95_004825 [Cadophora gregata]|uniref:uncharacterized protein n=1 Tax=Cadophora gregata TaxID=51156 RepID=UPI0026DAAD33|nr:uncharacterized protein ONS95_004825 [Cadophora gregata]KAK0104536.1 hypothetical protein ONS95_004825 [Cadophora gregata]KAK0115370.1 hypothetical protein ONS96_013828 [Cadophora gregata f. sp. sojae]
MGNLCGKESSDAFAQPGRTLAEAHPASGTQNQNPTASVPKKVVVGGPPRTLGSGGQSGSAQEDARRKAAEAAEARANAASKPKGKLGSQLQEQKKQTRSDTLEGLSKEERRLRDADSAAEARAYN